MTPPGGARVTGDVIIAANTLVAPDYARQDAERLQKLIGYPLTRIEVRANGLYLEFDPHGSITVTTLLDLRTAAAPAITPVGVG